MPRPPASFNGFIGQKAILQSLRPLVDGCMAKGVPFPHALLTGPSGSGKTRLAKAIASAFGTNLHYKLSSRETSRAEICELLTNLECMDFIFFDETHALRRESQEMLYHAIDEFRTLKPDRAGREKGGGDEWVDIRPCTIIAATDRPGDLLDAFAKRLASHYPLLPYEPPELREIAAARAADLGILLTPQARTALASASRGSPRIIGRLLERLQIWLGADSEREVSKRTLQDFLQNEGIGPDGTSHVDREYLTVLNNMDGCASLATMATAIGHDPGFLRREIEGHLIRNGLIRIEPCGRVLTEKGKEAKEDNR